MKEGYKNKKEQSQGQGQGHVRVTQPLSGQGGGANNFMLNGPPPPPQLSSPDFNNMYAQQNNPLVSASMTPGNIPGMVPDYEPAAANEHLGNSFF
jgi:hypothetical protein